KLGRPAGRAGIGVRLAGQVRGRRAAHLRGGELVGGPGAPVPAVRHDGRGAGAAAGGAAGDAGRAGGGRPAPGAAAGRVHRPRQERGGRGGRLRKEKSKKASFGGGSRGTTFYIFEGARSWGSRRRTSSASPGR